MIERSSGAQLWDIDGNRYIDFTMGFGANFLGHSPKFITDAIQEQLEKGVHIGPQSPLTHEVAALVRELTGLERVSFCNTGSEAVMAAIRVARTVTRRSKIVYFNGDYHGLFDEVLLRPQLNTQPPRSVPIAPGIPQSAGEEVWMLDYGTPASLEFIRAHAPEIAAVLVEPVQSRHPTLQPREFLHELRAITKDAGTILIFDEIITGFRVHPRGAQGLFGIQADLATYGKIVGGGLPIGVLAGSAACMDALDGGYWQFGDESGPEADVTFFAGTFVRHPLALAAAGATLRHLREQGPQLQEKLAQRTGRLADELNAFFQEQGLGIALHHCASQFRFHFPADLPQATLLVFRLLERGFFIRETHQNCFLSAAHTEADVAEFIVAVKETVLELQAAEFLPAPPPRTQSPAVAAPAESEPVATEPFPLTDAQHEVWLACQLSAGAPPPPLELPVDHARSEQAAGRCAIKRAAFDASLCTALRRAGAAHGCTLFATLLASFKVLLQRLSGQDETVVGIFAAGQATSGHHTFVGHCVNMLPIRTQPGRPATFADFLTLVNRQLLDAREHGDYTFGRLLQKLKLPRVPGRAPLVSAIFNLEPKGDDGLTFSGLQTELDSNPHGFVTFDVFLNLRESGGGILLDFEYNAALFSASTIQRWLRHFESLLRGIAADPRTAWSALPLLSPQDLQEVLVDWNATEMDFPRDACLHDIIARQAAETPNALAVVAGSETLTYAELDRLANRAAHYLQAQGVRRRALVGVCLPRTGEMLAALLGVLKAGAGYVPMDPTYPPHRLAYLMSDAHVHCVLTHSRLLDVFADAGASEAARPKSHPQPICLDLELPSITRLPDIAPACDASANDIAYVIYTSGSTGTPKGVAIAHRSAVSFVHWAREVYSRHEFDGVLAATSICFDLSIFELFGTLAAGGKIILAENALELPELPDAHPVRLMNTVPSVMTELLRASALPETVETINLAGEPLSAELVRELYARPHVRRVYDLYGPTECTTYATRALRDPEGRVTIGRPIANTQAFIVDPQLQPVPVGAIGELCLGGEGVALGYLHRPGLTAERFVRPPFGSGGETRIYRTGDRARFLASGNIEFLGRTDHQVKIRGYRVELGEIEALLRQHHAVREAVVIGRAEAAGAQCLFGYAVPAGDAPIDGRKLREHLQQRLPEYMVPASITLLENLPLGPTGKIDRAALPAPRLEGLSDASEQTAPRTTTEELLADIWREVLGLPKLGVHDNFFELGGHSLMAMQVISRISASLGVELSFRHCFTCPTIARLAPIVEEALMEEIRTATPSASKNTVARQSPVAH